MRLTAKQRAAQYTDEQLQEMSTDELMEIAHGTLSRSAVLNRIRMGWPIRRAIVAEKSGPARVKPKPGHPLACFRGDFYTKANAEKAKRIALQFERNTDCK